MFYSIFSHIFIQQLPCDVFGRLNSLFITFFNTLKPIHNHQCPSTTITCYSDPVRPPHKEETAGFAEIASAFSSGERSPVLNSKWITDTVASSHITPH